MRRKQWRQTLSGLMAGVMLLGTLPTAAFAWNAPADDSWTDAAEPVAARFFVGSDTHIGRNEDATKKLENALDVFADVDPNADGVLLAGDLTDSGAASQYTTLMNTINNSEMAGKIELAMGNHEYVTASGAVDRFKNGTQQAPSEVLYYNADGLIPDGEEIGSDLTATVVKLSAKNYGGDYTDNYDLLKTALETSDSANHKAPILVIAHHGVKDTAYVTNEWFGSYGSGDRDMVALMKRYPQVIHFSGHSHATLEDARSIHQDLGFTAIQDGTIGAYFENEKGKVDPSSGSGATRPADSEIASQALRVDVLDDGTVNIYRMNLTTGEYMYEPWVFNAATNDMPYTMSRENNSDAPSFAEDAAVTVDSITKDSAVVRFPAAEAASEDNLDMIHEYVVKLTPESGSAKTVRVFSDYYEPAEKQKHEWSVKIAGLSAETGYTASVTAETSFGVSSDAITGESFTTDAEPVYVTPKADVLNIDFADGLGADANGKTPETKGAPTFSMDETLGVQVAHFDGSDDGLRYAMTAADYNKYKDGYTMECLMKLNGSKGNPFSNQQNAGCGFELNSNGNTLEFWNRVGGEYKIPTYDISSLKNDWFHAVATFDGVTTKLYVNGVLQSQVDGAGSMTVPADGAKYFYLGADTNGSGAVQNACKCDIALARLYSGAMNAADVRAAYKASMPSKPVELPTADILNVDFSTGAQTDHSANNLTATKRGSGNVTYVNDATLGKQVANFGGNVAYSYPMTNQYDKLAQSMTFEVTYNYNALNTGAECDLLSNQQGGGFGIGTDKGVLKFFCHVGGGYKTPSKNLTDTGVWRHAVGVFDGSKVKLYLDGVLVNEVAASGKVGLPGSGANEVFIGGDSNANNGLQFPSNVKIATARIYSAALTAEQIAELADSELAEETPSAPAITFETTPAATCELNEKFTLPKVTFAGGSDLKRTITITEPSGKSTLMSIGKIVDMMVTGTYQYQLKEVGAWTFTYTATDTNGTTTKSFTVTVTDPSGEVPVAKADVLDVDFSDGTAADKSETKNVVKNVGSPVIQQNAELGKNAARFNGEYDAYLYPFDNTKYDRMSAGATIECVFRYEDVPATGEHDIFSNQQGGGIGLGLENGRLQFFCNVNKAGGGNGYVQPSAKIEAGQWYHAVGVFDGKNVRLFLNGEPVEDREAGGATIHWPTGGAQNFVIGGDSDSSNGAESFSNAYVSAARLYSTGMTAAEVKALYQSMEPPMIAVPSIGSLPLNQPFTVPAGTASNDGTVTVTVTAPDGETVALTDGAFTPTVEGDYTFTYSMHGAQRVLVRPAVDMENLPISLGLVTSKTAAAGGKFNVSIHLNKNKDLTVGDSKRFDLTYDPALVSYVGSENVKGGVTITDDKNGTLHIAYTGDVSSEEFSNYSATRLVRLTFSAKTAAEDHDAEFKFSNVDLATKTQKQNVSGATVVLKGSTALDKNGDGVIGAGDVALAATAEEAKLIAERSAIYPYKHVISITMDGGGICYNPDAMYYYDGSATKLSSDPSILAKRTSGYAMKLFNKYCATSYSARSETPTISAQNYTSILHGKEYATAQAPYQIDNSKTGVYYYPDFGKAVPVYPSVFKAMGESFPNRGNAAFAEWTQIVNGIVEPDAPVYLHGSTKSAGDMQDVADYIRSEEFENTAMVYMQSDEMDHIGHSYNFFSDTYYTELTKFDGYFQEIMKALEETGHLDDTLLLINSDHGGTRTGHGGTTQHEYDVQLALGGQTIDSGKRLTGGTNHDPSVLALTALRAKVPASMDGTADLFEQASLSQEQLVEKNRGVAAVTAATGPNTKAMELKLSNVKGNIIKAADLVLDLNGRAVSSITTSGTILRQTAENGKLYLTISYETTPTALAKLVFDGASEGVKVEEFMLGDADGKEIYGDLVAETVDTVDPTEPTDPSKPGEGGSSSGGSSSGSHNGGVSIPDSSVPGTNQPEPSPFQDVTSGDYFHSAVLWAVKNGITSGTSATTFAPNAACTRAQTVTFLWRAAGSPAPQSQTMPFADVPADAYYRDAVLWAVEQGITSGTSAAAFSPDATVTRAQTATFLWRANGAQTVSGSNPFHDVAEDAYYADAVLWAAQRGVTSGVAANSFSPDASCTRAQLVTFLMRAMAETAK